MADENFWKDKVPCWEIRWCSTFLRDQCPAYLNPAKPCWEIKDTSCDRLLGTNKTCDICAVYIKYSGV